MLNTAPACAGTLQNLLNAVEPNPAFEAGGVVCSWKDGAIALRHMERPQPGQRRGQPIDAAKPSAHTAMAKAADLERLRPLFTRWIAAMQADPAYTHAAHHLQLAVMYDGRCDFAFDGWRHGPDTATERATLIERLREGARHACDGTIQGCFMEDIFEGMARLHPATITALGRNVPTENGQGVQVHPWIASIAPLKNPKESHAYINAGDAQRVRALRAKVQDAVKSWNDRGMHPIMGIGVLDVGNGPTVHIEHVLTNDRIRGHCTIAEWCRTHTPPPKHWESDVLGCWNDLWWELSKDAPILEHRSTVHKREGRFPPAHTHSGFGRMEMWGQNVGDGVPLLLARGMETGPLHMAVSGDNGRGLPIHSADTRRFARFVRAIAPEGKSRQVHVFGPKRM